MICLVLFEQFSFIIEILDSKLVMVILLSVFFLLQLYFPFFFFFFCHRSDLYNKRPLNIPLSNVVK